MSFEKKKCIILSYFLINFLSFPSRPDLQDLPPPPSRIDRPTFHDLPYGSESPSSVGGRNLVHGQVEKHYNHK